MKELIALIAFLVLFFWNLILGLGLASPDNTYDYPSLKCTISTSFTYFKEAYNERNLFGIVLTSIVVFGSIPGFVLALIFSVCCEIGRFFVYIWNLGNKKEN